MDAPQPPSSTSGPTAAPPQPAAAKRIPTPSLIAAILGANPKASDLIFSPGRPPQAKANGQLVPFKIQGVGVLTPDDTAQIAGDLIGRRRGRRWLFDSDTLNKLVGSAWFSSQKIESLLGFRPMWTLEKGMPEMVNEMQRRRMDAVG